MTFALVLLLVFGGNVERFVMDHGLTAEDCQADLVGNPTVLLTCEVERSDD